MLRNFSWVIEGRLAGMAIPSGASRSVRNGRHSELDKDAAQLQKNGVRAVVSLTHRPLSPDVLARHNLKNLHIPVEDMAPPSSAQIRQFVDFVDETDGGVAVHCAAGIGRTGTMLGCYLVWSGLAADQAIRKVRSLRPGSIETVEQEWAVSDFAEQLANSDQRHTGWARQFPDSGVQGQVRLATDSEMGSVVDLMTSAFSEKAGHDRRADFVRRIKSDPDGVFVATWVLVVEDEIVSALRVYDRSVSMGVAALRCAAVGDVATAPDHQGNGYSSQLLRTTVRNLKDQGFDIAWLTGRENFYGRFGWHSLIVPTFEVARISQTIGTRMACTVRTIDLESDREMMMELYDRFNAGRIGTVVRSPEYWEWLDRYRMVWEKKGQRILVAHDGQKPVGYMILAVDKPEWRILEIAASVPDRGEIAALVQSASLMAVEANASCVRGVMPYDEASLTMMNQAGIEGRIVLDVPVFGNTMLKVFDLNRLLGQMIPELEARLRQTWQGRIALTTDRGDRVVLIIKGNSIQMGETGGVDLELCFGSAELTGMLLGYTCFSETPRLGTTSVPTPVFGLLESMFPAACPVQWATDYV